MHPVRLPFPSTFFVPRKAFLYQPLTNNFPSNAARWVNNSGGSQSASAKLFADAAREEAEEASAPARKPTITPLLDDQHENWTGEERIRDAVLRMLVDKYKPLRGGTIQTAEQKLRQAPPLVHLDPSANITTSTTSTFTHSTPSTGSWATEPLLPSAEDHKPWHTTFKAPSHATPSVKLAHFPPVSARISTPDPTDDRARKMKQEAKKRTEHAGRLSRAKESTLDYRLGIRNTRAFGGQPGRPNPVSLKGWASLIEDKIEKARVAGLFNTVKGRGQPLNENIAEANPFIAREEFLMNRIVQRNGAAPPWVEVQGELDTAIETFREILRQSWTRRAIRTLTTSQPAPLLQKLTLTDITSMRDSEWEQREKSYHETAIEELNSLVRKYNGLAPYAVRRPYYIRSVEVEKVYQQCGEDILRGLAERSQGRAQLQGNHSAAGRSGVQERDGADLGPPLRIRDVIRGWLDKIVARWRGSGM